jgi:hypothetical protein
VSYLLQWLGNFATWLWTGLQHLGLIVFSALMQGLATVIQDIPAPAFFSDISGWVGSIPPFVSYLIQGLEIPQGITIVCTAMVIRFLIRRLPFVG